MENKERQKAIENFIRKQETMAYIDCPIVFRKSHEKAVTPERAHSIDAGWDLRGVSYKETEQYIEYNTGIQMRIPDGYVGLLFPRSSITKYDLMVKNSIGVIDAGYLGDIRFRFTKHYNDLVTKSKGVEFKEPIIDTTTGKVNELIDVEYLNATSLNRSEILYNIGDKIGQIVFIKLPTVTMEEVDDLGTSERGVKGYGDTGK